MKIQFAVVEIALAGARIAKGVISALQSSQRAVHSLKACCSTHGYSQVIPSHPIAKKLLKTKRKTAAAIP